MALSKDVLNQINKSGIIPSEFLQEYISDKLLIKPYVEELSDEEVYRTAKQRLAGFAHGSDKVNNTKKKGK